MPSQTEPSCPASVPCLSLPCVRLAAQQCRMMPWAAGSKLSQALSQHFLQALAARTTDGVTLVSPLWLLATNWREVWYVFMPGREWHQLLPQAGAGQAVQPINRTLLGVWDHASRTCRLWSAWDSRAGSLGPGVTPEVSWHQVSGTPVLIINHPYRALSTRSLQARCVRLGRYLTAP